MTDEIITRASKQTASRFLPGLVIVALLTAAAGLFLPYQKHSNAPSRDVVSSLVTVNKAGVLRVGYEGYPPYTMKDPNTGKLTGFSVDLAEYIAKQASWKVEWVQTSPDTKIPDLQAGKFDVMSEPIFRTIPRATLAGFSRPFAYFGDASAIVRKGDSRFTTIDALNQDGIVIAVRQGYTDQQFAAENLPRATVRALAADDISQVFLEVMSGKADIALADTAQVKAFAAEHHEVEALFTDPAPSYIPAGFMFRQGDFEFYNFINTSLEYLEANGVIARLNGKYHLDTSRPPHL